MAFETVWNDARKDRLEDLWNNSNLSAREVAADLNCGLSKNAIISKVHRMKLPARADREADPAIIEARKMRKRERNSESQRLRRGTINPRPPVERVQPVSPIESLKISFADVGEYQCRWIGNEDMAAPEFCGHPTVTGKSWCAFHAKAMKPSANVSEEEAERRREHGRKLGRSKIGSRRPFGFEFFSAAMPVE